jgi:hypothetical protein
VGSPLPDRKATPCTRDRVDLRWLGWGPAAGPLLDGGAAPAHGETELVPSSVNRRLRQLPSDQDLTQLGGIAPHGLLQVVGGGIDMLRDVGVELIEIDVSLA